MLANGRVLHILNMLANGRALYILNMLANGRAQFFFKHLMCDFWSDIPSILQFICCYCASVDG